MEKIGIEDTSNVAEHDDVREWNRGMIEKNQDAEDKLGTAKRMDTEKILKRKRRL